MAKTAVLRTSSEVFAPYPGEIQYYTPHYGVLYTQQQTPIWTPLFSTTESTANYEGPCRKLSREDIFKPKPNEFRFEWVRHPLKWTMYDSFSDDPEAKTTFVDDAASVFTFPWKDSSKISVPSLPKDLVLKYLQGENFYWNYKAYIVGKILHFPKETFDRIFKQVINESSFSEKEKEASFAVGRKMRRKILASPWLKWHFQQEIYKADNNNTLMYATAGPHTKPDWFLLQL
jgi:hypothetical protein